MGDRGRNVIFFCPLLCCGIMLMVIDHDTLQIRSVAAKYIMKCDDDTFVRVDSIISEARKVSRDRSLYIGNMNYHHRPLRHGKWAVTYEV